MKTSSKVFQKKGGVYLVLVDVLGRQADAAQVEPHLAAAVALHPVHLLAVRLRPTNTKLGKKN